MADDDYHYQAFVSYRHVERDRKWAQWLVEKLESFRTPSQLVKAGFPARLGRIFRDDDEVPASSDLTNQITSALQQSKYLIVVCSPRTPHSAWVRREIEMFRTLGRGHRILALLDEAEPRESFPPELLHIAHERINSDGSRDLQWEDVEPIAADVRPRPEESRSTTERRAVLRIAAALLGCSYDDLAQRERTRRIKRWRAVIAIACASVLGATIASYYIYRYNTVTTEYFATLGSRWGVPFGIGKLSERLVSRRDSYAIDTQHGQVIRVRHVNGFGALSSNMLEIDEWNTDVAEWDYAYVNGQIQRIDLYDSAHMPLMTELFEWNGEEAVVLFRRSASQPLSFGASAGDGTPENPASGASEISQHHITYDKNGFVTRREFQSVYGTTANNSQGAAAIEYRYDQAGSVTRARSLGTDGQVLPVGAAVAGYAYSPMHDLERAEVFDAEGRLMEGVTLARDDVGNLRSIDVSGSSNTANLLLSTPHVDISKGKNGEMTSIRFLDSKGRLTWNAAGYAIAMMTYDADGNVLKTTYLGLNGKPTYAISGDAIQVNDYGDKDDSTSARLGLVTVVHHYGIDRKAIAAANGCEIEKFKYNDMGLVTDTYCFSGLGRPKSSVSGDSHEHLSYENRLVSEVRTYDVTGKLTSASPSGCAIFRMRYDEHANPKANFCFGADGKPTIGKGGYAIYRYTYQNAGNITGEDALGVDNRPILNQFGYASVRRSYDDHGEVASITFLGLDRQPTNSTNGFARESFVYSKKGELLHEAYTDASGQPVNPTSGYASSDFGYAASGYLSSEIDYSVDNKIVRTMHRTNLRDGFTIHVTNYFQFDAPPNDGGPCNISDEKFDDKGRVLSTECRDQNGSLVPNARGVSIIKDKYDAQNRISALAFFDPLDHPVADSTGCSELSYSFDGRGNNLSTSCLGPSGKLTNNNRGTALVEYSYDNLSRLVEQRNYDRLSKPLTGDGTSKDVFRIVTLYKASGYVVQRGYGPSGLYIAPPQSAH